MKKFMNIFLFFILSLFSLYLNVEAISGGYSGEGQGQGYTGGTSSGGERCTGGACLAAGAGLKFTLVNISNSKLEALSYGYMRSTGDLYGGDYFDNRNVHGGGAIEGIILSSGEYSYGAYGKGNYIELTSFSKMNNIIPKGKAGLNFYEDKLKQSILRDTNCSSKGIECILTDEFTNISVALLRKANIISAGDTLASITTEQKNTISNLRIIIEPVYALFLNGYKGSKYVFSTPKSIAYKFASSDYYGRNTVLGISDFANSLYKQIYTKDTLGTIINYPSYIVPTSNEAKVNSFLDLKSGAGYSIAKILYDNSKCDIKKEESKYIYIDDRGGAYANDFDGYNLSYYLNKESSGCGCEVFNSSSYKNEILSSDGKFQEIYDSICDPQEVKSCVYEPNGVNYTFYGKTGNILSSYTDFISDCGCTNVNVLALKSVGAFSSIYNASSCVGTPTESFSSNLASCSATQTYDEAKSNTNFDDYTLTYKKTTAINTYCTEVCDEVININDLKGKYTTEAGTYFEFSKYPNLVANKSCTVSIFYNSPNPNIEGAKSWVKAYEDNLDSLVTAYNPYAEAVAAAASVSYGSCCSSYTCGPYGTSCCSATKYIYDYSYYKVLIDNKTKLKYVLDGDYETSCGSPINWNVSGKLSDFQAQASKAEAIASLKNDLKTCNNRLGMVSGNETEDTVFYAFDQKLNYYYSQTYEKDEIGFKYNNQRSSYDGIDDSNFFDNENKIILSQKVGSGENKYYHTLTESGIVEGNPIFTYTSDSNTSTVANDIKRIVKYEVDYTKPAEKKYVERYTGKISTINNVGTSIYLGYVYDTDVSAKAMTDNENYYSFTKLGDENGSGKLFNEFKTGDSIKRYCDYEITNDIVEDCENGTCESKLDIVFRIVDSNNIDPNNRLIDKSTGNIISYSENIDGTSNGFKNWRNEKGKTVKTAIENSDTFNPENIEYSFTLDSSTIKAIRAYNANNIYCDEEDGCDPLYSSFTLPASQLTCESDGNKCKSSFIDEAAKDNSSILGTSKFALITNGRSTWKDYEIIDGKYYIDGKKIR